MTITTEPTVLRYSGNGSTTAFAITWKYFSTADMVATLRSSAGAETTWVLNTDYTLTAAGVDTGGTLTATTAPASGTTLVINLDPSNTQDSSLPRGGAFPSSAVEDELDQAAQRDAKLEVLWDRTLRVPKTDLRTGTDLELPIDTLRASKYLYFDGNGVPTAAAGTATLGETGLLSQDTESELTIASGSVTPTVSTHSIDTESDAATDNLDTIITTNLENGRLLLIRGENASRVVTVRDAQGGAGQIITATGENVALLGTTNYMLLQRRGTDWYEVQLGLSIGQGQGADIVSATALSVDVRGTFHDVTGTVTITSFDAVAIGTVKILQFDGALILTHHATDLILPGAANITTAAGDIGVFYEYATGDWRCVSFKRQSIAPPTSGSWTPGLTDGTNAATVTSSGAYHKIGKCCFISGKIEVTSLGSMSGDTRLSGLPFTSSANAVSGGISVVNSTNLAITANTCITANIGTSVTYANLQNWDAVTGVSALQASEISADGILAFFGQYESA